MQSSPTLQDFVLNLIYDPGARSAFEIDPQGALRDAGLAGVTATDVREVIPLVVDYAPLGGAAALPGTDGLDDLTTGVADLDVARAVAHLQAITAQVGGTTSQVTGDLNVAAAGAVTVGTDQLSGWLGGGAGLHGTPVLGGSEVLGHGGLGVDLGGLTADHDPAAGLDAAVTAPADHIVTDVSSTTGGLLSHTGHATTGVLDGTVNIIGGVTGSVGAGGALDLDVPGLHEATSSVIGSLPGSDTVGGLLPDLSHEDSAATHVDHHGTGVTDVLGGVTHAAEPDAGHDVLGGLTGLHF